MVLTETQQPPGGSKGEGGPRSPHRLQPQQDLSPPLISRGEEDGWGLERVGVFTGCRGAVGGRDRRRSLSGVDAVAHA